MGLVLTIRGSIPGNISDTFSRADGNLGNSTTETGNRKWSKVPSDADVVASIVNGAVKATAGAGTGMYLLDAGSADFNLTATVAAVREPNFVHSVVFRVVDEANHVALLFRPNATLNTYAVSQRVNGVFKELISSTVSTKVGDRVSLNVSANKVTLVVNGVHLGDAVLPAAGASDKRVGIRFAGADRDSALDNFRVIAR